MGKRQSDGAGIGSDTVESLENSSVEYFLLEPPTTSSSRAGGSRHFGGRSTTTTEEILSPISHRDSSINSLQNHQRSRSNTANSERLYFDNSNNNNDDDEGDVEEALTLPSAAQLSEPLILTSPRPRMRSSFSSYAAARRRSPTELSGLNYLNLTAYAAHLFVWYGIAVAGWMGHQTTRWSRTEQYETLVTPADWAARYLWIPIVVAQGVFALAQLLPHYRLRPIVTTGTGYFFFYTVLCQIVYTFLFSFGLFIFSFVAVVGTAVALLSLLISQHHYYYHHGNHSVGRRSSSSSIRHISEYLLFRLPFYLHTGWVLLMTVDHFALLFRRYAPDDTALQLAVDVVALAVLLPVAVTALTQAHDFVIPLVILWSYVSITATKQYLLY